MQSNKHEIFDAHFGEVRSDEDLFKEVPDVTDEEDDPESEENQKQNADLFERLYGISMDDILKDDEEE